LWELIYFVILVAIAVLWAPSKNSQRYAYSVELSQLDEDSEWQEVQHATATAIADAKAKAGDGSDDQELDGEYGGKLHDEKDPFQGTGALDPIMAISKKA
jgi:hypothetical protein